MPNIRFWEIDFLRGIAVALMIIFNYAFALHFFAVFSLAMPDNFLFWFAFPRFIGAIFIFLAGVSLVISYNRAKKASVNLPRKYTLRGARIFALGMLITAATYIFLPRLAVFFGILHLIGISIVLAFPLVAHKNLSLLLGIAIIMTGIALSFATFDFSWLLWAGFMPSNFQALDYFPLVPWFGVMLLGVFLGNNLYGKERAFRIADLSRAWGARGFCLLGRHSLVVYFAHIPFLILLLYSLGFRVL